MTKKFMLGIEAHGTHGATQGVGYNFTFQPINGDTGFRTPAFEDWRKNLVAIVLRHRDDVFDSETGEEKARQLAAEVIAISQSKGHTVVDDGDVPAIQVSGIDLHHKKKGKKLDISIPAATDVPALITPTVYHTRRAQEINCDGAGGVRLPSQTPFQFTGRVVAV
ncbi:MAG TPA: hypothetical protein VFE62_29165 [Gemmataceae bacterium]|nr:hypothetical protein [Gemmataceae bacterium]